jgi:hypothetical protein
MPQPGRIVGIDVAKAKVDACIRSLSAWLSQPSTPQGQAEMIAWLRENGVALAVMEASGGYERDWAQALRQAGIAVGMPMSRSLPTLAPPSGGSYPMRPLREWSTFPNSAATLRAGARRWSAHSPRARSQGTRVWPLNVAA